MVWNSVETITMKDGGDIGASCADARLESARSKTAAENIMITGYALPTAIRGAQENHLPPYIDTTPTRNAHSKIAKINIELVNYAARIMSNNVLENLSPLLTLPV